MNFMAKSTKLIKRHWKFLEFIRWSSPWLDIIHFGHFIHDCMNQMLKDVFSPLRKECYIIGVEKSLVKFNLGNKSDLILFLQGSFDFVLHILELKTGLKNVYINKSIMKQNYEYWNDYGRGKWALRNYIVSAWSFPFSLQKSHGINSWSVSFQDILNPILKH